MKKGGGKKAPKPIAAVSPDHYDQDGMYFEEPDFEFQNANQEMDPFQEMEEMQYQNAPDTMTLDYENENQSYLEDDDYVDSDDYDDMEEPDGFHLLRSIKVIPYIDGKDALQLNPFQEKLVSSSGYNNLK